MLNIQFNYAKVSVLLIMNRIPFCKGYGESNGIETKIQIFVRSFIPKSDLISQEAKEIEPLLKVQWSHPIGVYS